MSTYYYLVCLETMQSVEVAASIGGMDGGSVRSTQEPKALAMFCIAHAGMGVEMMNDDQLEGRKMDHGELTEWTAANAEERFKAVAGETPPSYD
ncbi:MULTISPECIES: hypothetical protein [Massilia]|jgi:hypothetical protein|uniref:hypothetical protein n=1 Tax=Massilia TaxID=149698 RepID=UPI0004E3082C|nr:MULTISPECIES: hypothetical protein [Massilia]KFC73311.1 hypothetical protein FG94_01590 [Massilia sp. LC238]